MWKTPLRCMICLKSIPGFTFEVKTAGGYYKSNKVSDKGQKDNNDLSTGRKYEARFQVQVPIDLSTGGDSVRDHKTSTDTYIAIARKKYLQNQQQKQQQQQQKSNEQKKTHIAEDTHQDIKRQKIL